MKKLTKGPTQQFLQDMFTMVSNGEENGWQFFCPVCVSGGLSIVIMTYLREVSMPNFCNVLSVSLLFSTHNIVFDYG